MLFVDLCKARSHRPFDEDGDDCFVDVEENGVDQVGVAITFATAQIAQ